MNTIRQNIEIPNPKVDNMTPPYVTNEGFLRVTSLETKASHLEHQFGILSAKVDSMITNQPKSCMTQSIRKFVCHLCDFEGNEKEELKTHILSQHTNDFKCNKCQHFAISNL